MTPLICLHLVGKAKPFSGRHPTALPDVLTEGAVTHLTLGAAREVTVDVVVEIHPVGHLLPVWRRLLLRLLRIVDEPELLAWVGFVRQISDADDIGSRELSFEVHGILGRVAAR